MLTRYIEDGWSWSLAVDPPRVLALRRFQVHGDGFRISDLHFVPGTQLADECHGLRVFDCDRPHDAVGALEGHRVERRVDGLDAHGGRDAGDNSPCRPLPFRCACRAASLLHAFDTLAL